MRANGTADPFKLAGLVLASAAIATAVGLVGCSSKTASPPAATSGSSGTSATSGASSATTGSETGESSTSLPSISTTTQVGNTIVYALTGQTSTIPCENGKSLNVTGGNNTLTVTGTCDEVSVAGVKNTITFENKITSKLTILGINNTLNLKGGKPPKFHNIGGSSNTINET